MMPKDHPCKRECPDRAPGCNCEKLTEYNRKRKAEKNRRHIANTVDDYQKDAVRRSKRYNLRRKHRV